MPKLTIKVPTETYGEVPVEVEVFGLLGVQPQIYSHSEDPTFSDLQYGIVHLATGYLINGRDYTHAQAVALAEELATIPGWEKIPKGVSRRDREKGRALARETTGEEFRLAVIAVISRHHKAHREAPNA